LSPLPLKKPLREGFFRCLNISDKWFSSFAGDRAGLELHKDLSMSDGSLWLQFDELFPRVS